MSLCSIHAVKQKDCGLCNISLEDEPLFQKKKEEAELAGRHECICGFTYYKTVDACPLCNTKR